ncbi:MAG: methyltransferase domain-containing protein [Planctomycetaceae bacterium]|nr:methyltransferase domain-containing protein [Planctomycetaceae bacterium]
MSDALRDLLARYHAERGGSAGETAAGVRELSDMFNGLTPHRPGYLANPRLRRAYVHYYLPVNAEKVARVLRELDTYAAPDRPAPRVLDFGCGPGTAAVAALLHRPVADLVLVDVVDEALDDARFFCRELGVTPRTFHEVPKEKFDLILAANVFVEQLAPLEEHLNDDGYLVVVEPALQSTTRKLEEWRDEVVRRGYRIAAPCVGQVKCPMLERTDLWCHQDVSWPRPATVSEIDRRLGLNKESLKYSYMVVTRHGRGLDDLGGDVRVVSNLHKEKGKAWAWVCGKSGPLCRAEVLTRHRSESTAAFFHADRGDVLKMKVEGEFTRSEGPIERTS